MHRVHRPGLFIALLGLLALGASCTSDPSPDEAGGASQTDDDQTIAAGTDDGPGLTASTVEPGSTDDSDDSEDSGDTGQPEESTNSDSTSTTVETPAGYCDDTASTEVRFERGEFSAVIDDDVDDDQPDRYRLEVGDDQILAITLRSGGSETVATIVAPGQTEPSTGAAEHAVAPTTAGYYQICVSTDLASAPYQLIVSVVDDNTPIRVEAPWCGDEVIGRGQISFERGQSSTTVENGVLRAERDLYTFEAEAGQDIELEITSIEDNARFGFRSPSGEVIERELADLRLPLPETGVYELCVGSARGNASYSLELSIS